MSPNRNVWPIILAGGEGSRLASLTADDTGVVVPKQYCSFRGTRSLFGLARQRAERIGAVSRVVAVVAAAHREWWSPEVAGLSADNVLVQPCNRGTACGLLLPLLHVVLRDPEAVVVVLPSDHFIAEEGEFERSLVTALHRVLERRHGLVLLGVTPDEPEYEYGWIRPGRAADDAVHDVESFVEKPPPHLGEELLRSGALWNSFVIVGRASSLVELFERTLPWLTRLFRLAVSDGEAADTWETLPFLYDHLPDLDFSRAVLENAGGALRVLPVPPCGWADLGTPRRVAACVQRLEGCPVPGELEAPLRQPPVDLARAVRTRLRDHGAGGDPGGPTGGGPG